MNSIYDEEKLRSIVEECHEHNENIGAPRRDEQRVIQDAKNIYIVRHSGITVETLAMMLTDYMFAARAIQKT